MPAHFPIGLRAARLALDRKLHRNAVTRNDRLLKRQRIEPGIGQHRARTWLHKKTCGKTEQQIPMRDAVWKKRIGLGCLGIHMRVKPITGKLGKMLNIGQRDLARSGVEGLANLKRFKTARKGMRRPHMLRRACHPNSRDG